MRRPSQEYPVLFKGKKRARNGQETGTGVFFGAGIGIAIGTATGEMGTWIAFGVLIGLAVGLAISAGLYAQKKRSKDQ